MLPLDPPLAALHGARLDRTGDVAHGLLNATEHFLASTLRIQNTVVSQLADRAREHGRVLSPMVVLDAATDPSVGQLGADFVQEQILLTANLGERLIALGEWHQHGINAVFSHWLERFGDSVRGAPFASGIDVLQQAVESADRAVSGAAAISANATEAMADEAVRIEKSVRPRRRA